MKPLLILAAAVAGCTTMPEIQPIGQGRYMVGTSVRGGLSSDSEVKAGALGRARSFCAGQGKALDVVASTSSGMQGWTPQNAEVVFRCE